MSEQTWVKFNKINEKSGEVEIHSGILEGMTATKACIKTMSGLLMIPTGDVVEGYHF